MELLVQGNSLVVSNLACLAQDLSVCACCSIVWDKVMLINVAQHEHLAQDGLPTTMPTQEYLVT